MAELLDHLEKLNSYRPVSGGVRFRTLEKQIQATEDRLHKSPYAATELKMFINFRTLHTSRGYE